MRIVDAFVDELDLASMGFKGTTPANTGRPSYHPAVLHVLHGLGQERSFAQLDELGGPRDGTDGPIRVWLHEAASPAGNWYTATDEVFQAFRRVQREYSVAARTPTHAIDTP